MHRPLGMAGLGASLAINAYRTLKLLEFGVTVLGDDYDFYMGSTVNSDLSLETTSSRRLDCT